ncbi:hypothetical protein MHBO_002512 [Bonamia ostreae]|uniref:Ribosomal protein L10 n=1 Tax=Bonamia ostreae TaxID=126728 RepID=A0ABV2AMJ2_9EUKA
MKYGNTFAKITQKSSFKAIKSPFVSPDEKTRHIKRLTYHFNYQKHKSVFKNNKFVLFFSFYNTNGYSWDKKRIELASQNIFILFVKPKMAQKAVINTPCEPVKNVLTQNTFVAYWESSPEKIINDHSESSKIVHSILEHPGTFLLCGIFGNKVYYGDKLTQTLAINKNSPTIEMVQALNFYSPISIIKICRAQVVQMLRSLKWFIEEKSK